MSVVIGTAGWTIGRHQVAAFANDGTHLRRYAGCLRGVEINSCFYRSHSTATYERWREQVPAGFRFAVKLPRTITHERALRGAAAPLEQFLDEVRGLGRALGPILIQLPPSLAYEAAVAGRFFELLRKRFDGGVVCEPRHTSWATAAATRTLCRWQVGRVAADPPRIAAVEVPGGWLGAGGNGAGATIYYRLHGSPRIYWSPYDDARLDAWAAVIRQWPASADVWCMFDNTASGAALTNALALCVRLPSADSVRAS